MSVSVIDLKAARRRVMGRRGVDSDECTSPVDATMSRGDVTPTMSEAGISHTVWPERRTTGTAMQSSSDPMADQIDMLRQWLAEVSEESRKRSDEPAKGKDINRSEPDRSVPTEVVSINDESQAPALDPVQQLVKKSDHDQAAQEDSAEHGDLIDKFLEDNYQQLRAEAVVSTRQRQAPAHSSPRLPTSSEALPNNVEDGVGVQSTTGDLSQQEQSRHAPCKAGKSQRTSEYLKVPDVKKPDEERRAGRPMAKSNPNKSTQSPPAQAARLDGEAFGANLIIEDDLDDLIAELEQASKEGEAATERSALRDTLKIFRQQEDQFAKSSSDSKALLDDMVYADRYKTRENIAKWLEQIVTTFTDEDLLVIIGTINQAKVSFNSLSAQIKDLREPTRQQLPDITASSLRDPKSANSPREQSNRAGGVSSDTKVTLTSRHEPIRTSNPADISDNFLRSISVILKSLWALPAYIWSRLPRCLYCPVRKPLWEWGQRSNDRKVIAILGGWILPWVFPKIIMPLFGLRMGLPFIEVYFIMIGAYLLGAIIHETKHCLL